MSFVGWSKRVALSTGRGGKFKKKLAQLGQRAVILDIWFGNWWFLTITISPLTISAISLHIVQLIKVGTILFYVRKGVYKPVIQIESNYMINNKQSHFIIAGI